MKSYPIKIRGFQCWVSRQHLTGLWQVEVCGDGWADDRMLVRGCATKREALDMANREIIRRPV